MKKRKICVVTGSRADYGLLKPLLDLLKKDPRCSLQLIVTGSHLSEKFGRTINQIYADGFKPSGVIALELDNNDLAMAESISIVLKKCFQLYQKLKPEIVVVLGDRYEIFAASLAAFIRKIPLAHIHGGELTEGVLDDGFRHAITKMSLLHFTSTQQYHDRVIQLGEDPSQVFNLGAIGLDNLNQLNLLSGEEIQQQLKIKFKKRNFLITFHPVTLSDDGLNQLDQLFKALDSLKDSLLIFTYANADSGGTEINKRLNAYVKKHKYNAVIFKSLGQLRYLSLMKYVDAVIGNSSSGIIEAPSLKTVTVNIGDRQKGRVKAVSVIDCQPKVKEILSAIKKACSNGFINKTKTMVNPYAGKTNVAAKIKEVLLKEKLNLEVTKKFYDVKV